MKFLSVEISIYNARDVGWWMGLSRKFLKQGYMEWDRSPYCDEASNLASEASQLQDWPYDNRKSQ